VGRATRGRKREKERFVTVAAGGKKGEGREKTGELRGDEKTKKKQTLIL